MEYPGAMTKSRTQREWICEKWEWKNEAVRESVWVGGMYVAGGLSYIGGAGLSLSGLRLNRRWNTFHYRFIEGTDSEDSFHCQFFSKTSSDVPDTQLFECMHAAINAAMYAALLLATCYVNETLILRSFF
jgi:hypothetical protein